MAAEHERVTFSTDTFSSIAMNVRMRAESSTPAMPITRSRGNLLRRYTACDIASSGLATGTMMQFGECLTISRRDVLHDLVVHVQQVVAAHARLARHARGDDDDVGVGALREILGADADHARREPSIGHDCRCRARRRRPSVGDVHDDDVRQLLLRDRARHRCANVARAADDCHFSIHADSLVLPVIVRRSITCALVDLRSDCHASVTIHSSVENLVENDRVNAV